MMARGTSAWVGALLIGGAFLMAGCIDSIADFLDPPEVDPDEPHKRLGYMMGHAFVGGGCFLGDTNLPAVIGPYCIDVVATFGDMRCDPAQLWVMSRSDQANGTTYDSVEEARAAQQGVEGPPDAYLYCELELDWWFNARSIMPESEFHVTHEAENHLFEDRCSIPVQSNCGIELSYTANFTVNMDKESEIHEESGVMEIRRFEPLSHEWLQSSMVFETKFWLGVD